MRSAFFVVAVALEAEVTPDGASLIQQVTDFGVSLLQRFMAKTIDEESLQVVEQGMIQQVETELQNDFNEIETLVEQQTEDEDEDEDDVVTQATGGATEAQEGPSMPTEFLHELKAAGGACVAECDALETGKGKCKKACARAAWGSKTLEQKQAWIQAKRAAKQAANQAAKAAKQARKDAGVPASYEGTIEEWQALGEEAQTAYVAEQEALEHAEMPSDFLHELKAAGGACVEECDALETGKGKCKKVCARAAWDSKTLEQKKAWKQAKKEAKTAEKQAAQAAKEAANAARKAKKDAGVPVTYEGTIAEWQALGEEAQTAWKIARRNEWLSRSLKDIPSWLRGKMLKAAYLPGHSIAAEADLAECASETKEKKQRKCKLDHHKAAWDAMTLEQRIEWFEHAHATLHPESTAAGHAEDTAAPPAPQTRPLPVEIDTPEIEEEESTEDEDSTELMEEIEGI